MSIITREFINKRILFENCELDETFEPLPFEVLSDKINRYKNLLQEQGAEKDKSVVIGLQPTVNQTACIFACLELGMSIVIIDYGRADNFTQYKFVDPKTEILSPIDFFIVNKTDETDKYEYFSHQCGKTVVLSEYNLSLPQYAKENTQVLATPDTVAIKCTSSGTTGTPKKILHTHEFLYAVSSRNSKMYDGTVGITTNLNHGSSIATYYLPALCSENVSKVLHLGPASLDIVTKSKNSVLVNHLMLPYKDMVDEASVRKLPNTTLYTLSMISKKLKARYRSSNFKDIVSIFGCNETSGPTLINRLSEPRFRPDRYFQLDDFYKIEIVNKTLHVTMPVYGNTVNTSDIFLEKNGNYYFQGRNDLQRINGTYFNLTEYAKVATETANCNLIFDTVNSEIYLAVWDSNENVNKLAKKIDKRLKEISNNCHFISKAAHLKQDEFLSGVKIDHELLREYFRKYVPDANED